MFCCKFRGRNPFRESKGENETSPPVGAGGIKRVTEEVKSVTDRWKIGKMVLEVGENDVSREVGWEEM